LQKRPTALTALIRPRFRRHWSRRCRSGWPRRCRVKKLPRIDRQRPVYHPL